MSESQLQKMVVEFLRQTGAWFYHPKEGKRGSDGIPDIIGVLNGYFFAIELKNPESKKPKLRPEQARVLEEIKQAGGACLVSNNFDEVVNFINALREKKSRKMEVYFTSPVK